jgi:hypothetical protein
MTYSHQGDLKAAEPVARYLFYRSHLLDRHTEVRRDGYAAVRPQTENCLPAIQFIIKNIHRTDYISGIIYYYTPLQTIKRQIIYCK